MIFMVPIGGISLIEVHNIAGRGIFPIKGKNYLLVK